MYIIIGVVIAGLLAGVVAFFIWRSMSAPAPETAAIPEQQPAQPITVPTTTEQVVVPVAPEPDSVTIIEQDLSAFNATSVDAELQGGLAEITKSL